MAPAAKQPLRGRGRALALTALQTMVLVRLGAPCMLQLGLHLEANARVSLVCTMCMHECQHVLLLCSDPCSIHFLDYVIQTMPDTEVRATLSAFRSACS